MSAAVGAMLASTYDVDDGHGGRVLLPRGDVLVFGGDISYPVATADEIYKRLVLPWNEQLRKALASSRKRVVLGVPGNHDWYDGLDGFGRLFRRRIDEPFRADDKDNTPRLGKRLRKRTGRKVGLVARQLHLDEVGSAYGLLVGFFRSVRAFFNGRRHQAAAPPRAARLRARAGGELLRAAARAGARPLRRRSAARPRRLPAALVLLEVAEEAPRPRGALRRRRSRDRVRRAQRSGLADARTRAASASSAIACFFLAGDFHHYERRTVKRSMHVIAGGGGAFLHGTRIGPYPKETGEPDAAYPSGAASRKLVAQVPVKLDARARGLARAPRARRARVDRARRGTTRARAALVATSIGSRCSLVARALLRRAPGPRQARDRDARRCRSASCSGSCRWRCASRSARCPRWPATRRSSSPRAFGGSFVFGVYLTLLAVLGLEHQQAFTVLGHPGFKHFVRLCVHPDGRVEGWTIGKDDMLADSAPLLVDRFEWTWAPPPAVPPVDGPRP